MNRLLIVVLCILLLLSVISCDVKGNSLKSSDVDSLFETEISSLDFSSLVSSLGISDISESIGFYSNDSILNSSEEISKQSSEEISKQSSAVISKLSPTVTNTTSSSTSSLLENWKTPFAADKLGFGIWGLAPAYPTNTSTTVEDFKRQVDRKYTNHDILQAKPTHEFFETIRIVSESGGMVWLDAMTGFYDTKTWKLFPDSVWKEDLNLLIETLKDIDLWKNVAGFIWDEPDLKPVPLNDFRTQTEYLSRKYKKRLFTVFSIAGFAPEYLPSFPRPQITSESTKYLTDIAFDMYGIHDKDEYRKVNNRLKAAVGRSDEVRVWYFPVAFEALGERKDEKYALDFLNMCYELLMEENRPGGLILYCWPMAHEIGLEDMLKANQFAHYEKLMVRIGKEIIKKPLN